MTLQDKTLKLIETAYKILEADNPMTVRQVYYQLVARHIVDNNRGQYQKVCNALVRARKEDMIPWEWIEDRLRQARTYTGYRDARSFVEAKIDLQYYYRHPWQNQDSLVELWLEKDALSGILGDYANQYYLTLNVGRGYDGWSSIHNAAERYDDYGWVTILYFGDFDPSGEDMVTSLEKRLYEIDPDCLCINIVKVALTRDDIEKHNLPPDFTKASDTRSKAFIEKHGDIAVELDALPPAVLRQRVEAAIREHINIKVFEESQKIEAREKAALQKIETSLKKSADRLIKKELS
jgi:hypothetical protein